MINMTSHFIVQHTVRVQYNAIVGKAPNRVVEIFGVGLWRLRKEFHQFKKKEFVLNTYLGREIASMSLILIQHDRKTRIITHTSWTPKMAYEDPREG